MMLARFDENMSLVRSRQLHTRIELPSEEQILFFYKLLFVCVFSTTSGNESPALPIHKIVYQTFPVVLLSTEIQLSSNYRMSHYFRRSNNISFQLLFGADF